eukprot:3111675-Rhodomonas_salina.3
MRFLLFDFAGGVTVYTHSVSTIVSLSGAFPSACPMAWSRGVVTWRCHVAWSRCIVTWHHDRRARRPVTYTAN